MRPVGKPVLLDISALAHRVRDRHLFLIGDPEVCRAINPDAAPGSMPRNLPADLYLAAGTGRLASKRARSWRSGNSLMAEPVYIRPPDALKKKAR